MLERCMMGYCSNGHCKTKTAEICSHCLGVTMERCGYATALTVRRSVT